MKEKRPMRWSFILDHFMLGFVVSSFKFSWLRKGTCNTFGFIQVTFVAPWWSSSYLIKVCTKLIVELSGEDLKQQQNKLGRGLGSFLANFEVKLTALIWTKLPVVPPQAFQHHFMSAGFPATHSLAPGRICRILSLSLSQGGSHQANIQVHALTYPKTIHISSSGSLRRKHAGNRNYPMSQLKSCSELTGHWTLTKKEKNPLISNG